MQTLASQFALSCATPTTDAEKDVADLCEIIDELEDKVREISSPQPTDDNSLSTAGLHSPRTPSWRRASSLSSFFSVASETLAIKCAGLVPRFNQLKRKVLTKWPSIS